MTSSNDTVKQEPDSEHRSKILEPEFTALTSCLKDAVIKTGQIYQFYADVRKLKIDNHVPNPPRSLSAALGYDLEKYDQLCDSIEAHLLRAINVLKRDLYREERRLEAEERRKLEEVSMLPPPVPPPPSVELVDDPATQRPSDGKSVIPRNSPITNVIPSRRPSVISISSLQRPQFPLKLDLSSASLRISEEEATLFSKRLASPVTLAPKSARPLSSSEFPSEFMDAFNASGSGNDQTNIDLTLPDTLEIPQKQTDLMSLGVGLGDSSDKPIVLDLDTMDIEMNDMTDNFINPSDFNTVNSATPAGLLSVGEGERPGSLQNKDESRAHPSADFSLKDNEDLFGDFNSESGELRADILESGSSLAQQTASSSSPGSMLAQFTSTSDLSNANVKHPPPQPLQVTEENFDMNYPIDLSHLSPEFFSNEQDVDMSFSMDVDAFLGMASTIAPKADGGANNSF